MALNFASSGESRRDISDLYPDHFEHYKTQGLYPINADGELLDFDPTITGSDSHLHSNIANMVLNFARESGEKMSVRHPSWRKIDETQTSYIPTDAKEDAEQLKDTRKPVHIVMPMSKACLETQVTYDCAAALEDPIFGYEGVGPEDRFGAMMCELEIRRQSIKNKFVLNLMTFFRDARKYGLGVIHPQWYQRMGQEVTDIPATSFLGIPIVKAKRVVSEQVISEGNRLFNIDPYRFWPDPKVSISDIQDAEFLCWGRTTDRNTLLSMEKSRAYGYFNCEYLRKEGAMRSRLMDQYSSGRDTKSGFDSTTGTTESTPVDVITMFVRLVPFDVKLGSSRYPEVWCFEVAGDQIVIKAEPMNFWHGMYPICVGSPSYDGYSICPTSDQESVYGMQMVLDFLINQFIRDQKKTGADMLAADPSMWDISTLEDPEPGRVILLDRDYWGRANAVNEGLTQLKFNNTSGGNIMAAGFFADFMKQVTGANDNVQGVSQARSEAITAAEASGARQSSLSRLQKDVRVMDVMGLTDMAIMLASNTQQFMSLNHYVRVTGRNEEQLMGEFGIYMPQYPYVMLNRDLLNVNLDILPRNGTIPGGANLAALQAWFQTMMSNVGSASAIDVIRYGKRFAREAGIQGGVDDLFIVTPQQRLMNAMLQNGIETTVSPDEEVEKEAQAGNLVPIDQATGVF